MCIEHPCRLWLLTSACACGHVLVAVMVESSCPVFVVGLLPYMLVRCTKRPADAASCAFVILASALGTVVVVLDGHAHEHAVCSRRTQCVSRDLYLDLCLC